MKLFLGGFAAPVGDILLVHDEADVLRALDFTDHAPRMHHLLRLHYGAIVLTPRPAPGATTERLTSYFAGDLPALDGVVIATGGTPFQREVWAALRRIPAGGTTSYGELAAHIGRHAAVRAVGAANGANPIGIVVPCHRVIGASGRLTGYAGGLDRKAWLLAHEADGCGGAAQDRRIHGHEAMAKAGA